MLDYRKCDLCWSKAMWLQKDITPDFVPTMSHWLLAKLLSFMIEIGEDIEW